MASQPDVINSPVLKFRKLMGRMYLNQNRIEEALEVFGQILQDHPDDVDSLLAIGNGYLACGNGKTARNLFQRAIEIKPEDPVIENQIMLAESDEGSNPEIEAPTNPKAIAVMLQLLTGKDSGVEEEEIDKAAELLDDILNSQDPAGQVAVHLDEMTKLLPALIEINIRQALADAKPELAKELRDLQITIKNQYSSWSEEKARLENGQVNLTQIEISDIQTTSNHSGDVLLLTSNASRETDRICLLKSILNSKGYKLVESNRYSSTLNRNPQFAIVSNPHTDPSILEGMAALSASRIPIIMDLDTDIENLPESHPNYSQKGLGTPARRRAYNSSLLLANLITVPSEVQAASLQSMDYPACVIPDGWSSQNPLWEKGKPSRNTINIGWMDYSGQLDDLFLIRRVIIRIIREFPNTQLVITGNSKAYQMFDSIDENRRMFIPFAESEEEPFLLSQIDILLVPLNGSPYNVSLSDRILVEAGVKNIPWIASPIPAFEHWKAGGIINHSPDDWHANLRQLVMSNEIREILGQSGFQKAKNREAQQLESIWMNEINSVLRKANAGD